MTMGTDFFIIKVCPFLFTTVKNTRMRVKMIEKAEIPIYNVIKSSS